jgi:NitT/TauT family transport system permease protein
MSEATAARGSNGFATRGPWQGWAALVAVVAALAFPLTAAESGNAYLIAQGAGALLGTIIVAAAVLLSLSQRHPPATIAILVAGATAAALLVLEALPSVVAMALSSTSADALFGATIGFWALAVAAWLLLWLLVRRLSEVRPLARAPAMFLNIVVPLIFGAGILFLWEVLVRGLAVPFVILPPPSAIWARLTTSVPTLWIDFQQTFLKSVLAGYAIGCLSGFLVAIVVDRVPFLKRGLLPVGNLVSALPIIGIAPIMVMWFGFDWPSKAAVVVAMTFFPMLVNTLAGLSASDQIERDLMRTYAASYWQSLFKLRLPAALPFIFNALKINSTLAMIGAIVAEFFGTPVVGMGFRISTEVGRMNTDMVWAEIAVAALAGSAFYGVVALIERVTTFWHPSFQQQP